MLLAFLEHLSRFKRHLFNRLVCLWCALAFCGEGVAKDSVPWPLFRHKNESLASAKRVLLREKKKSAGGLIFKTESIATPTAFLIISVSWRHLLFMNWFLFSRTRRFSYPIVHGDNQISLFLCGGGLPKFINLNSDSSISSTDGST